MRFRQVALRFGDNVIFEHSLLLDFGIKNNPTALHFLSLGLFLEWFRQLKTAQFTIFVRVVSDVNFTALHVTYGLNF